jgi:hypothetical protein
MQRHRPLGMSGVETDMHRLACSVTELVGFPAGTGDPQVPGFYHSLDDALQQNIHGKIPAVPDSR